MSRSTDRTIALPAGSPKIICLCGSTRFGSEFAKYQNELTAAGYVVLTVGSNTHSDDELFIRMDAAEKRLLKAKLDVLHFWKILIADEVLVLDVDPATGERYVGESVEREMEWAKSLGKDLKFVSRLR